MKRLPKGRKSWVSVLLIVLAVIAYVLDVREGGSEGRSDRRVSGMEKTGRYEFHEGCRLVENRRNDGDSFMVRLPDGREALFRLYFADAPESAFRSYGGGRDNPRENRGSGAADGRHHARSRRWRWG